MKPLLILLLLSAFHLASFGQQIDYSLPPGFDKTISQNDYKTIADQSVAIVSKKYKVDNVKNGTIIVGHEQAFDLDNLVSKCIAETDHTKWASIISEHFNALFSSMDQKAGIDLHNYETVKPYLSIRIYPAETVEARGGTASLISRTDLEGTLSMLMLDLPQAFTPVSKTDFDTWHKTTDETFKAASDNIAKQPVTKVSKTFKVDNADVEFNFIENEDYAASYALNLEANMPDMVGEWGSVVAIPNKGLVTICKISKAHPVEFVKFIQRIKPLIEQSYSQHPNPVSTTFFWYYKGRFTPIPIQTDDKGNINVMAPMQLSSLMTK
jgi:hypothetical protein